MKVASVAAMTRRQSSKQDAKHATLPHSTRLPMRKLVLSEHCSQIILGFGTEDTMMMNPKHFAELRIPKTGPVYETFVTLLSDNVDNATVSGTNFTMSFTIREIAEMARRLA